MRTTTILSGGEMSRELMGIDGSERLAGRGVRCRAVDHSLPPGR